VLRVGVYVTPNSLTPLLATDTTENMLNRLVFDTLTSVDGQGKHVPILAQDVPTLANHGVSPDGLDITFHLRHGVRWQDGAPFTSHDVTFTYDAIMNPRNNVASHTGFDQVAYVKAPDPYTVHFHLKRAFAPIVDALFGESDSPYPILPAHLLEHVADLNQAAFNSAPIGTGPFTFVKWVRGDRIEYAANPQYFRGRPKLDRIVVHFIPDENSEVASLEAHEIDWYFEPSPNAYAQLRNRTDLKTMLVPTNQYSGMLINTSQPMLREVLVRRAIAKAIDKNALVQRYTFNSAVPADQDLPPWVWGSPGRPAQPASLDDARALLHQAGFHLGPDGVMTRGHERLDFVLSYAEGNATNRLISVDVQARLREIGIATEIKSYLPSLLFAPASMGGILSRGIYNLNLSGWVSGVDPDNSSQFMCSEQPPTGSNESRLCDPAMDDAQRLALSRYDRQARKAAYATIEQVLAKEVPEVFFYYPRGIQAYSPTFRGLAPNSVTESWNAFQWTTSSPTTRQ
jgi:peptide/nickel transport system substrate-binding protein